MNYSIFISLIICFILFPGDVRANNITGEGSSGPISSFTKESCLECCRGLTEKQAQCSVGCHIKFSSVLEYNSRNECNYHCKKELAGCRQVCLDDCANRFPYTPPGYRAPPRIEKKRIRLRAAYESAGLPVRKTTPRDLLSPKPRQVRKKRKEQPGPSETP